MTFRKALVLPVALLIAVSSLSAFQAKPIDVTGVWTGTATGSAGQAGGAHIALKQKGAEVTGTAGPAADRQQPISNGKIATVKGVTSLTFDVTQPSGPVLTFALRLVEGRLKGTATGEADGQKREMTIDVGRAK